MSPSVDRNFPQMPSRPTAWRGRSGRLYDLSLDNLATFTLRDDTFSIVARGSLVMWVGTAGDVVNDHSSRARFRLALEAADRAYSLPAPLDQLSRMTMLLDLEDAEPLLAAAA